MGYEPAVRPELSEDEEAALAKKMHRLYRKDADERKAISWGVRHGLTFAHAQAMWKRREEAK